MANERSMDNIPEIATKSMETATVNFLEKQLTGNEPPRCVDGRQSTNSEQGPQMLGGTLQIILLNSIFHGKDLNEQTVQNTIEDLHEMEFRTGAHRGSHAEGEKSDCGFADRIRDVLKTATEKRQEITERLKAVYEANREKFPDFGQSFDDLIKKAYEKIESYSPDHVMIKGEQLVSKVESINSTVETVEGDHAEEVAFVNIKAGITLDTQTVNSLNKQAFNMDLTEVVKQAGSLAIDSSFSIPASLILYQATEMVLVEDKGKKALPVAIHV